MSSIQRGLTTPLPVVPEPEGRADCDWGGDDEDLPEHIAPCPCDSHDGVCEVCEFHVTIGRISGNELGHARNVNRREAGDCPHRPDGVDPLRGGAEERRDDS